MTGRLDDRIALITGSDSGIGQGTAIEFAKEGADVVVHYLDDADGRRRPARRSRRRVVARSSSRPTSATSSRWTGCLTRR